ncbi:MAG: hypothetical protein JW797_01980 [Bradymonadales bacterium]|nr:hypothetical protein [Bradymonadales bacterium]
MAIRTDLIVVIAFVVRGSGAALSTAIACSVALFLALSAAACSSSSDSEPGGSGTDASDVTRRDLPGSDPVDPTDTTALDSSGETAPTFDIPRGDGQLGEECSDDSQCASGVCWTTAGGSGCSVNCRSMQECLELGPMTCLEVRQGNPACATDLATPPGSCQDHLDCPFPYHCQEEYGWCALPECTWDGDCLEEQVCQRLTRRCEPIACQDTIECEHPLEVCRDRDCQPPECTEDSQCDGIDFCHPNQLVCTTPQPCSGEEQQCVYNEECIDGYCYPNPCWAECEDTSERCDPETGVCGRTCSTNGQCPQGQACRTETGICYRNSEPFAHALVRMADLALATANVPIGTPVQISGEGSLDPEGEPLTYRWMVNAAPEGSVLQAGSAPASSQPSFQLTPDVPGLYAIGLWVTDPGDLSSMQEQVILYSAAEGQ